MTFVLFNLLLAGAPPFLVWNLAETTPAAAPVVQATGQYIIRLGDHEGVAEGDVMIEVATDGEGAQGVWVAGTGDCQGAVGHDPAGIVQFVHALEGEDADGPTHHMFVTAPDGSVTAADSGPHMVFVRAPAPGGQAGGGGAKTALVRVAPKGEVKAEGNRGWLGVSVGQVSDALAAQLDTKGNGAVILNVVSDSPADKAGFQAHDIIVSINGEAVEGQTGKTVDLIKSRKPGENINVAILRDGQPRTLNVTLGSRTDMPAQAFSWKFDSAPEGQVEESIRTRGKFIAKDANGQWIVRDLGDVSAGGNLPDNVRMFLPRSGERSTSVTVEDGKRIVKTQVSHDGSAIAVERQGDGPITVERTDANGNKTEADYDTEEALQTADAEAYKVFQESGAVMMFHMDGNNLLGGNFDFNLQIDPGQWEEAIEGWDEHLGEAKEAYQKAMEELHTALENAKVQGNFSDLTGLMKIGGMKPGAMGGTYIHARPRQSFEVRPDGTIESRIRKGDSELVELYKNESDLQKRNPELFEKYQDLRSDDE